MADRRSSAVPYNPLQTVAPQAQDPGYQSTAVPSGAFDSGASGLIAGARQVSDFSDELFRLGAKMQQEDDEAAAREADIKVADEIRSVVWGTKDKPGYFGAKGKDALDNYGAAESAIEKSVQEAIKNAPNAKVASMLQRTLAARRQGVLEQMNAHAGHQRSAYMDGLNEARQQSAMSDAALSWNSDKALDIALGVIKDEAGNMAQRNGLGSVEAPAPGEQPSAAYVALQQTQSKAIGGAFDAALASGDFERARAIMSRYDAYLTGQTSTAMEKRIRTEMEIQKNKREAAEAKYQTDLMDGMYNKLVAGTLTTSDIFNSGLKGRSKYMLQQILEKDAGKGPQDEKHPALFNELSMRVFAKDNDPRKIVDEDDINAYVASGELSVQEGVALRRNIQELRRPEDTEAKKYGAATAKEFSRYVQMGRSIIAKPNPVTGMADPEGEQQFYEWQFSQRARFDRGLKEGKSAEELLDPGSKSYLGTPIAKTMKQIMQERAERMRTSKGLTEALPGGVPDDKKRRQGESIDDYLKRTGAK